MSASRPHAAEAPLGAAQEDRRPPQDIEKGFGDGPLKLVHGQCPGKAPPS